ncbi:keratin, type I cytoskeletal 18 isoform X2 [Perca flavescens]|uniref:keratin, type I cytoskeletal 18 isoform X2 n=1 Tax=Perca flavescens TaxID=8167 RepID=UPI00106ECFFC|nr:keratin, type I cytoskeletal 18-like isoform X2 [Perca flavescens]
MPSNSVYGGAGGRGSRVSVASLEGLRNVLRNETERDAAPATPAAAAPAPAPAAPAATPADDKQTLRGLNGRLSGYLDQVKQLEKENGDLEKQIDDILAKRKTPEVRDWDEVGKPLDNLKQKIKDITKDNAKLLLMIDNTKLANDDFKKKLDDEKKAQKELEKDLKDLKKTAEESKLNRMETQKEIELVKEELALIEQEHKEEVDVLLEKIKNSEVTVEIESKNSNLAEIVDKIRSQYDNLAKKNLKDTEDWYQNKFENIKVVEAQNNEVLNSGKSELKELQKQAQSLDVKGQGLNSKIRSLEEALRSTKVENNQRLSPLNQRILNLQVQLKEVRDQVERHVENNKDLMCVKMKLEAEINNYQQLMQDMTADNERPAKA